MNFKNEPVDDIIVIDDDGEDDLDANINKEELYVVEVGEGTESKECDVKTDIL